MTNEMRVIKPKNPSKAVYHDRKFGPSFNNALVVLGRKFLENGEYLDTQGDDVDSLYPVPKDL